MRIAFLSVSAEMGGSETILIELIRGLRRLAPEWDAVLVVPREGPLPERARQSGAAVRVVPMPPALARLGESAGDLTRRGVALLAAASAVGGYVRALRATLRDVAADVVHTNGFKLHVAGARAASSAMPLLWHVHEYVTPRPLSRRLMRAHVARVGAIVANSTSVAEDVRASLHPSCPVASIYNAVDLREYAPDGSRVDLASLAGMPPGEPDVVTVGLVATFGRWKGHETFLRAMQRVLRTQPNIRPYVIGGPLYDTAGSQYTREELGSLVRSLGLDGRVGFTGFIDRPAAAFRALDVVVHASTQAEPFGLVIAEAMACGRAVVTSAAGGSAELVTNTVDAITHAPGNPDDLAAAIARVTADAGLRQRIGRAARARAERIFDPDVFTRAFLEVYSTVVHPITQQVSR